LYSHQHHLTVNPVLVSKPNLSEVFKDLLPQLTKGKLVGFDIESQDSQRHQGLNQFMNLDPTSPLYKKPKTLIFDINRTVVTGFSIYIDKSTTKYYFNLNQADIDNRIPWEEVLPFFKKVKSLCIWVCHNYAFEKTIIQKTYGFDLGKNYIDTLQMAVSAYNSDEYNPKVLIKQGLGDIKTLFPAIATVFKGWESGEAMNTAQTELLQKVISKQSTAAHSYNGLVKAVSYGYGLKKAVKSFFNYQMDTFEDTLTVKVDLEGKSIPEVQDLLGCTKNKAKTILATGERYHSVKRPDMGWLTGEDVLSYGADDSYWCIRLFHALFNYMQAIDKSLFVLFMKQENPMSYIFSTRWQKGVRVNLQAIKDITQIIYQIAVGAAVVIRY